MRLVFSIDMAECASPSLRTVLTPRQFELAALIAEGKSNKEIALQLGIGIGTVSSLLVDAYSRAYVDNRTKLAARYLTERVSHEQETKLDAR